MIVNIPLTEPELKTLITKAKENFNIAKLDNLRPRNINIQFDCILRGYAGEFAMQKWLAEKGIVLSVNNYISDDDNIDIDFLYKGKNIELKTSLVPDADDTIENAVSKRDIKLIKREDDFEKMRGDIHLQIFFDQHRKAKDEWLVRQRPIKLEDSVNKIYESLLVRSYIHTTYFVGWIDKATLFAHIGAMHPRQRTWTFPGSKRDFWNCKLTETKDPLELPEYLAGL